MTITTDAAPAAEMSWVPLRRFELASSADVDNARSTVAEAFCRHQLSPIDTSDGFAAQFNGVQLGSVGLYYLDYGSTVRIDPRELDDFYLVQIPLAGYASIHGGGWEVESGPGVASILQPTQQVSMRWRTGNRQLLVHIDSDALHDRLRRRLGYIPRESVRFDSAMRLDGDAERVWVRLVRTLVDNVDLIGADQGHLAVGELGDAVMNQLLLSHHNNYSDRLHEQRTDVVVPRPVRRAADLLEARMSAPVSIPDIAGEVGLSVRSLQLGFRTHFGTTPSEHLRSLRLARVHAELRAADATETTVSDVALRWGFTHLGRFAAAYRSEFGETPASTLRRW